VSAQQGDHKGSPLHFEKTRKNLLKMGEDYGMIGGRQGVSMADEEHLKMLKRGMLNNDLAVLTPGGQI